MSFGRDPNALLRWLAELRPGGGVTLAEVLEGLGRDVLGAETVLVTVPTWRANAPEVLHDAVADLAWRAPRVVAAIVEVDTFAGTERAPKLDPRHVDALADTLWAAGATVVRVGAETDLRAALGDVPTRTRA
jgi:hypothetical protein